MTRKQVAVLAYLIIAWNVVFCKKNLNFLHTADLDLLLSPQGEFLKNSPDTSAEFFLSWLLLDFCFFQESAYGVGAHGAHRAQSSQQQFLGPSGPIG